tara:strand:- start:73 stop:1179 length:1107 start_codon:yes stop_codon:yes gene_type:complete
MKKNIKNRRKILIVGEWCWPWYQEACSKQIQEIGWKVIKFGWNDFYRKSRKNKTDLEYHTFYHRLEYFFQQGPIAAYINYKFYNLVAKKKPNYIWFYNALLISENTIRKIKKNFPDINLCQFSNDNPFSPNANKIYWRHFVRSIKHYDYHFCYRAENQKDYKKYGIKDVKILRSYFIPSDDYPLERNKIESKFKSDVVFAGHYENDGRLEILSEICKLGYNLKLYGGGWNKVLQNLRDSHPLKKFYPVYPATGNNYRKAICGSLVALCFLSKLNKDTYTRRNFQIPAMKVAVLSEYTRDLSQLFRKNKEIVFFKNKKECIKMLSWLIENPKIRESIAEKSFKRVYRDQHDVKSRMQQFIRDITIKNTK